MSVKSLWLPITLTALTTIAAFIPILVTTGIMGQFIVYPFDYYSISLMFGESFFLLPARLVRSSSIEQKETLTNKQNRNTKLNLQKMKD